MTASMKARTVLLAMTISVIFSSNSSSLANPTPIGGPGNTLMPFSLQSTADISIEEESLVIEDGCSDSIPSFVPNAGRMPVSCVRYEAQYRFRNKSGKARKIKVGFPTIVYAYVAGGSYGGLTAFSATYGDTKVEVYESSQPKPMVFPRQPLAAVIKDLEVEGLTRNLECCYDFVDLGRLGKSEQETKTNLSRSGRLKAKRVAQIMNVLRAVVFRKSDLSIVGQSLDWHTFELSLPAGLSERFTVSYKSLVPIGQDYSFSYILTTARLWGQRVGRLSIEIKPDSKFVKAGGRYEIFPKGKFVHSLDPDRYAFKSENRTPDFDIHVNRIPPSISKRGNRVTLSN